MSAPFQAQREETYPQYSHRMAAVKNSQWYQRVMSWEEQQRWLDEVHVKERTQELSNWAQQQVYAAEGTAVPPGAPPFEPIKYSDPVNYIVALPAE